MVTFDNARKRSPAAIRRPVAISGLLVHYSARALVHQILRLPVGLQRKLIVGPPHDAYEQEADRVADAVMRMPDAAVGQARVQRMCTACEDEERELLRLPVTPSEGAGDVSELRPDVEGGIQSLTGGGQPLPDSERAFFEPRFDHDFANIRVHTGAPAAMSARAMGARAYTLGEDIVFGEGEFAPTGGNGRRLLAHELTHAVQQGGQRDPRVIQRDLYTPEQRRAMSEGRVTGTAVDIGIASVCDFRPGDIVFRLGSRPLAERIHEPVTHGGIYLGDGLIHDVVGFGNRTVPLIDFYNEAADAAVVRIIRFTGPLADIILPRLIRNIRARYFDLPSDPVPWNLFSSGTDYRTATCLEYSHAQFLHAIHQIRHEAVWSSAVHAELERTYFRSGAQRPDPLIQPRALTVGGAMGIAVNERRALVAAATASAEDVDPRVFQNRWEGQETLRNVGTSWYPTFWQEERLDAFTYGSFVDATQFFRALECPRGTGDAVPRYRQQVLDISPPRTVCGHGGCVTSASKLVWAELGGGRAYLVQVHVSDVSGLSRPLIRFNAFVDQDLSASALSRAASMQPGDVTTVKWSDINGIPFAPPATTAVRP